MMDGIWGWQVKRPEELFISGWNGYRTIVFYNIESWIALSAVSNQSMNGTSLSMDIHTTQWKTSLCHLELLMCFRIMNWTSLMLRVFCTMCGSTMVILENSVSVCVSYISTEVGCFSLFVLAKNVCDDPLAIAILPLPWISDTRVLNDAFPLHYSRK